MSSIVRHTKPKHVRLRFAAGTCELQNVTVGAAIFKKVRTFVPQKESCFRELGAGGAISGNGTEFGEA